MRVWYLAVSVTVAAGGALVPIETRGFLEVACDCGTYPCV